MFTLSQGSLIKSQFIGLSLLLLISAGLIQSCGKNDSVLISGQVIEKNSGNAVRGAIVEVTQPQNFEKTVVTDTSGVFSFELNINDTQTITIEASKQQYQTTSQSFKVAPGNNVNNLSLPLSSTSSAGSDSSSNNGNDNGDDVVGGESGGPASMELQSISNSAIAIRGTGGDEESKFTFAVKDSAGRPVDQGYQVRFSIIKGPGGGARVTPSVGITNSEGMVSSSIASGDSAGVIKIQADVQRSDIGIDISSNPVLVAVGNGFPEADNFHISPLHHNFEGYGLIYSSQSQGQNAVQPNYIVASLSDYRHNPVLPGTAVDFTATAGNITASAITDENGTAVAELRPDGSKPQGNPRGIGFATITARTVDVNDQYITQKTDVLFTSRDPEISLTPTSFNIPADGSQKFTLTIKDANGYPVAAGSQINVSLGGGLTTTFDPIVLGDYTEAGPGRTEFKFEVSDADDKNSNVVNTSITVSVTLPSGITKSVGFEGKRAKIK